MSRDPRRRRGSRGSAPIGAPGAVPAIAAAAVTAVALVVDGGVLAEERGLLAISGLGGAAIGLLAAAAASPDGGIPAPLPRADVTRIAAGLAIASIVLGALGMWAYGRLEGGVMDPLTYLWTTLGPYVPAEAVLAGLAAVWGAGAGPVRWRA